MENWDSLREGIKRHKWAAAAGVKINPFTIVLQE